jgi:hypothetical protein
VILPQNGQNGDCNCGEGRHENAAGELVPNNLHQHSCSYVRLRNSLLSRAESFANSKVPEDPGGRLWSRALNQHMKKLMHEAGNGKEVKTDEHNRADQEAL